MPINRIRNTATKTEEKPKVKKAKNQICLTCKQRNMKSKIKEGVCLVCKQANRKQKLQEV